jgi:hypothetical protein
MARKRRLVRSWSLAGATVCVVTAVHAGPFDPSTLRDQLEEQVMEGDQDAEDLAVLRVSKDVLARPGWASPVYVALSAFAGDTSGGRREYGAMLVLQLPLERFLGGRAPAPVSDHHPLFGDQADDAQPSPALPGLLDNTGDRPSQAAKGHVVMTAETARACVRAAWRAIGLADDAPVDSMASRARTSAALPELRLRAMRTIDESGRITLSDTDPYRYTEAGGATNWLEARVTFRLDRLLFADEEVSLERVRLERTEVRARTAAKVLQVLFEWQRARALVEEPTLSSAEHFAAVLRELEASAILDVMTDGWFGRYRASLGPPPT